MIVPYERDGITFADPGDVEHFQLDEQPPAATPGNWYAPYTGN